MSFFSMLQEFQAGFNSEILSSCVFPGICLEDLRISTIMQTLKILQTGLYQTKFPKMQICQFLVFLCMRILSLLVVEFAMEKLNTALRSYQIRRRGLVARPIVEDLLPHGLLCFELWLLLHKHRAFREKMTS